MSEGKGESIRLLLIEDDDKDAELVRIELERGGFELDWHRVDNEADLRKSLLNEAWDVIISDFSMPRFDGMRAFQVTQELSAEIPFIFVSGALGEERAVEAMRIGARDYFIKGNLARLALAVRREIAATRTMRSERRLQIDTRREQRRLGMAVEASGAGIFEFHTLGEVAPYASPRLLQILGMEGERGPAESDIATWTKSLIHPEDSTRALEEFSNFIAGKSDRLSFELRLAHTTQRWVDVAVFAKLVSGAPSGEAKHVIGVVLDLAEQRKLEEQLREAQKMEAVGRLAGGVAHDFNNLLTVIFSFGRFALRGLEAESSPYRDIQEVLKAADRAHALTGQLLTFSRRKPTAPKVVDVNELIDDLKRMLARVVGEDVQLDTILAHDIPRTRIDPGSFEQVVMNLAVNARDAMPGGGRITIETEKVVCDRAMAFKSVQDVPPGTYVCVSVTDDGAGMNAETQRRVFEPFFTTKEVGAGTGLGLSTCYGIVRQAGGFIGVTSAEGKGTTFHVLLSGTAERSDLRIIGKDPIKRRGSETVLIVEDEEALRSLTARVLSELGYQVLHAKNGIDAISKFEEVSGQIDLLLTDVVMPQLGGKTLAQRLTNLNPRIKVLFMSGYAPDLVADKGIIQPGLNLLEKPFTPDFLGAAVRSVLDERIAKVSGGEN